MSEYLFLDPSMSTIGWCSAEFSSGRTDIKSAGRIFSHGKAAKLKSDAKIDLMLMELGGVLYGCGPKNIVIEIPSGHVHETRHGGGGFGLSVYGFAVGHVRQFCQAWVDVNGGEVISVTETEWTGGHGKQKHELVAARVWPEIKKTADPGHDIADAIALAEWWRVFVLRKQVVEKNIAVVPRRSCFVCNKVLNEGSIIEVPYKGEKVEVCKAHIKPDKPKKKRRR